MRFSWLLAVASAACGTDRAVPVDATLDLDDAFGTGIDAPPDTPPISRFPVLCSGMLTMETRMGPDPFGGALGVNTPVGITYGYDPALADENPDPAMFDHDMIGGTQASLRIAAGTDPQWVFETVPAATNCRLTITNGVEDRLAFGCVGMTATPALGAETTHDGQLTFSSTTDFLSSDEPPNGAPPLVGSSDVTRTFVFSGDGWSWQGTLSGCQ